MILIYCATITSRKEYIFKHVFRRLMLHDFRCTSSVSEFVSHSGVKFSYGPKPLGEELFIWSYGLLDEIGIDNHDIEFHLWEELPIFFKAPERSDIPFDIFSAAFYLITRYEEYLPQVKDDLGRYSAKESTAVKGGFILMPLVDLWVRKLLILLNRNFDTSIKQELQLKTTVTIEVSSFFKYQGRGVIDNAIMLYGHIKRFKVRYLWNQILVLLGLKMDPYNNYQYLIHSMRARWKHGRKTFKATEHMIFFFHLGRYNLTDNGISHRSIKYREAIKEIGDYVDIGLRYTFFCDDNEVKAQGKKFEQISNRPLSKTMAAYSKIATPGHYKRLVDLEKLEDYSMGYETMPGFRASTSHPFYFYDLDYEVQTPLLIYSYALHYKSISSNMLNGQKQIVQQLKRRVEEVSGHFIVMYDYAQFEQGLKSHATTILEYIYDKEV
ncbi:hypothetical protein [Nonlabens sp.]|uniref:DUF7033 domain-containing protein n=1 Tax=Nonlabens sp. TaxID=1888209 RepID=UPI0025E30A09|nr:hypothetical protein [Nonlabens sp.]